MDRAGRRTIGFLVAVAVLLLPGFLLHAAPRFPGSLLGSMLGIAAAVAMTLLLAYSMVKHVAWIRQRMSLGSILNWHTYMGAVGAVLGILHTGHKYQSALGIVLVASMLLIVLSGFAGRYYLAQIGTDIRDQRRELGALRTQYDAIAVGLATRQTNGSIPRELVASAVLIPDLVGAIADLENALGRREAFKRTLSAWIVVHIIGALLFYPLLTLHVWSSVYYGLRWLR